jgi:hypothetical protein
MIHVFYIQNHITKICMESIIDFKQISWDKVIVICFEKYYDAYKTVHNGKCPLFKMDIGSVEIKRKDSLSNFLNEWKRNKYVKKIVGQNEFELYTPVDNRDILRHLIFLKQCKNYYLIEEGLATYFDFSYMIYKNRPKKWKHLFLPKASQYISQFPINKYPKLILGYGFSKNSFNYLNNKVVIPLNISKNKINEINYNRPFFIFDGLVDNGQCNVNFIIEILRIFFKYNKITDFYFKFHTRQSNVERNEILIFFDSNDIKCHQLPDNTVIEEIIVFQPIAIYGFFSSLLFYNRILNKGETFSLANLFVDLLPEKSKEKNNKSIFGQEVRELFKKEGVQFLEIPNQ